MKNIIQRGLKAKRESTSIEFKEDGDNSNKAWCEIIKDIIAIANSGGGAIFFGINDEGDSIEFDTNNLLKNDPAAISDKIKKYTGVNFSGFEISLHEKDGKPIAVMKIEGALNPIVFSKPGTYQVAEKKQERAFSEGMVYFRHGAKSEPGATEDIRNFIDNRLEIERTEILENITQVVEAPQGSKVTIIPPGSSSNNSNATMPVRLVHSKSGTPIEKINPDLTHPFRQKDVILEIKKKIPENVRFNQYDVRSIKNVYKTIVEKQIFTHKPKFSTTQYSQEFVNWIIEQYSKNNNFFEETRDEYRRIRGITGY